MKQWEVRRVYTRTTGTEFWYVARERDDGELERVLNARGRYKRFRIPATAHACADRLNTTEQR